MTNGEWIKSYGYDYKDLDFKQDRTRSNVTNVTYFIFPTCGGMKDQNIGDITVPYAWSGWNAKGQWVMENKRWMGTVKSGAPVRKKVNVLVMDSAKNEFVSLPEELVEDIKKLIGNDGKDLGEIWTLTSVISSYSWDKSFKEFPTHFDYFVFQNKWGGLEERTGFGMIDRSVVADELYLANHPWKYVWQQAGHNHEHHWLKASDRNRDIEIKMNAMMDEIDALKEKLEAKA